MSVDQPLPIGKEGPQAEQLADQMLKALNKPAWDSLNLISWSFPRGHHFKWDKVNNKVEVRWDDYRVLVLPDEKTGEVYKEEELMIEGNDEVVQKALNYFYNDSFWLIAPYKVNDPGTVRQLVNYDGREALLVQYTSGGATPGDSYLWILDENFRPVAWKLWVDIIPIGGLKFSWENWQNIDGAWISTFHDGLIDIKITNLTTKE